MNHSSFRCLLLGCLALTAVAFVPAADRNKPTEVREHWAYRKPVRPKLPQVKDTAWPRNAIDFFTLAKLEQEGLRPSPEADRATLVRRVSLDLTGLPPTVAEVDAALDDRSPDWYEKVVERLLASPRYGERWARPWLDLARYADTNGYEKDKPRTMWLWRDWVIRALNDDLPFDQFTIEQLAGDLLPPPLNGGGHGGVWQKVATGFHRNSMLNDEGGINPEEFRVVAVKDRVDTTATVWLGTTLECAQCHNHKYDPFTQTEYYRFYAFFNHTVDTGVGNGPEIPVPTPEQQKELDEIKAKLSELAKERKAAEAGLDQRQAEWEKQILAAPPPPLPGPRAAYGLAGALMTALTVRRPVLEIVAVPRDKRTAKQRADLAAYYRTLDPELAKVQGKVTVWELIQSTIQPPTTMVMQELPKPRENYVMERGDFRQKGKKVEPGVPAVLHPWPEGAPPNRLGLARWLVDKENPLVARVTVNRFWEAFWGRGLVQTLEDFGTQGEPPTHPELLDWLAVEFRERGWSMKVLHRLIVTSATYRQASKASAELLQRDPHNLLCARGPRLRVEYEMLRDLSLSAGGLLGQKLGGPSVMPPQPSGIWENSFGFYDLPNFRWKDAAGEDRYRRGIYTFLRRTALYPAFTLFDAQTRDVCSVKRARTNTPLQALATLNDPAFVEAAGGLARRIVTEAPAGVEDKATFAFRICVARKPEAREAEALVNLYKKALAKYEKDPKAAAALVKHCRVDAQGLNVEHLAAWVVVANVLLNLDETLTKG